MTSVHRNPLPVPIDPHFSPQFYAELWGMASTVIRCVFRTWTGSSSSARYRKTKRTRIELRIPFPWRCAFIASARGARMRAMLTLQRRHSQKCPDKKKDRTS